ncbi:MAG: phosphoribosylformimino-5-aminoimidazole carboxamide ribotide isomerase [Myxococcota bacterium]|jgi:phosphoribosylformimino-5-aminoimidazole carboxamide ribotide isomerase
MTFQVIPAVDLRGGNVVRLVRGNFDDETIYHSDPAALARDLVAQGATRLHVVDLDGARDGQPTQQALVRDMIAAAGVPVQVGGGIRTLETMASYLEGDHAASWIIVGTIALRDPELVKAACKRWPGRIIVGVDARKGRVAVSGWLEESEVSPLEVVSELGRAGVAAVVYTDIARDGTGDGPNVEATAALAQDSGLPIIASGGVATTQHIAALGHRYADGVVGVVVGKAILSGSLSVAQAIGAID